MSAGYSGTPLARKLGIRPGALVALLPGTAPAAATIARVLEKQVDGSVRIRTDLRLRAPHDVVVVFVRSRRELAALFERARARLTVAGGLWVAWPKQSSALAGELRESAVRSHGLASGLVDNKVCAIDEDWSGLRFVVRLEDRPGR